MGVEAQVPMLVGRGEELRGLESFLDAVERGPAALVFEGDAGIGKTSLWRVGVDAAERRGHHVLTARLVESEQELSFAAFGDLLAPLVERIGELPAPQRRALRAALLIEEPEGGPQDQRAIGVALHSVLLRLTEEAPVVVAVDDLQWLDRASRSVLEFAMRRLEAPVGLLASARPAAEFALGAERLLLSALDVDALATLLRERLGLRLSRPTLLQVERASAGNPLHALELGRALLTHDGPLEPGEPLPVPATLHELLASRLGGLSAPTRVALVQAATLGRVSDEVVPAGAATEALTAGVLVRTRDGTSFSHPLLASVLVADANSEVRRDAHTRVAAIVTDPEERARHLAAAATAPDEKIATALEEAAKRARARGAPEGAASLVEEALRMSGDDSKSVHRLRLEAATCHFDAGEPARARALVEQALANAEAGAPRAQALLHLGDLIATGESVGAARAAYVDALAVVADDVALRAALETRLARIAGLSKDSQPAARHAQAAVALAEQAEDPSVLVPALIELALEDFKLGRGVQRALLKRALAIGPAGFSPHQHPRMMLAGQLMIMGSFDEAHANHEAVLAEASEAGDTAIFQPLAHLAGNEWLAGRYDRAKEYGERAVAAALQSGRPYAEFYSRGFLTLVEACMGEIEAARANVARALPLAEASSIYHTLMLRPTPGFLALSLGRPSEAHDVLGPCVADLQPLARPFVPPDLMYCLHWVVDDVDALVQLGQLDRARELGEWVEGNVWPGNAAWAAALTTRARGLVTVGEGDLERAIVVLERSVSAWQSTRQPFPLGRALLTLGAVQRRARRSRAARISLQQALEIFERLPARLWAENARTEIGRLGGRPARSGKLTPTEEQIATLVAAGRSNANVARALVVSPKTIEWHLSRIYRKLHVQSRTELAAKLARSKTAAD